MKRKLYQRNIGKLFRFEGLWWRVAGVGKIWVTTDCALRNRWKLDDLPNNPVFKKMEEISA